MTAPAAYARLAALLTALVSASVTDALAQQPRSSPPVATPDRPIAGVDPVPPIQGRIDPETYRIGPGDELVLRYSNTADPVLLRISPTGHLLLPKVGPIQVGGLTLDELEFRAQEHLRSHLRDGVFALALHRPRRFRLLVVGEVKNPGSVTLQAPARASEAIAAAGGVATTGARRGILLRRDQDTLGVDLAQMERTGDLAGDPLVFEEDVIQVPARGSLIEILGSVPHPGPFDFVPGDRLGDLIALAGGVLPQAALEHSELTRVNARGVPERRRAPLEAALRDPEGPDNLALAEGDRLYVPAQAHWRHGSKVEVAGEVARPGPYPIVEGVDRVRSVLERAGGLTEFAESQAIRIERQTTDSFGDSILLSLVRADDPLFNRTDRQIALLKARQRQAVSADVGALLEQGDESGNALLLDGDRIVVPRHRPIVSVQGEVRAPGYVRWVDGRTLWDYVREAGGLTKRANRAHVRVTVATTGQRVDATEVVEIRPEDVIWVPAKRDRTAWEVTRDLLAATAQAATFFIVIRETTK